MKEQILKSRLSEILDLTQVDWNNVFINTSKNYTKVVADYYNKGMTSGEISKILNMDRHTVQKKLADAKEIGWVDYVPISVIELCKKDVKIIDTQTQETIIIHGVNEACNWFKEKYNMPVDRHTIKDYVRGERVIYYGGKHVESLSQKLYKGRFKFEHIKNNENK